MRWSYLVTEKEKGPETILIVDDDSEIREILRILLCRNGFIVKEVSEVLNGLKYYLDNITNWNKCMIYSYELGKEYNTASLIRKWKGVMKQVEQD